MLGIIVQLAISWLLIWLIQKKDLRVLGLLPNKQRLFDFLIFFLVTSICCSLGFLMRIFIAEEQWQLNPNLSAGFILSGIWWNIKSVLFEELIFRGVLLYILLIRVGAVKAVIISAAAFGIYHWFSFNIIGNVTQMIIVFFITGIMGLLLAYGYVKTLSLYVPVAIHLGWNLTQNFIFSTGPTGDGIFISGSNEPFRTNSYFLFFTVLLLPMLSMWIINFLLLKRRKGVIKSEMLQI